MDKLIRRSELSKEDIERVEDPFFAVSKVKHALLYNGYLWGKTEFLEAGGIRFGQRYSEKDLEKVLDKIKDGSWLFLTSEPFRPMRIDGFLGTTQCFPVSEAAPSRSKIEKGPGKWRTIDIDYDGLKNTFAMLQNRLGSLGDEGRVFGSEGKDFDNTTRVVTQQWVPLDSHDDHLASRSVVHPYGKLRAVTQRYLEGDDKWQISGKSWYWQPVLPHETYEHPERHDAR